jgi:putative two-component system response regulator
MTYKILIVDDEAANLRLLERLFRREYQVISATSGAEALELLKLHDVALIISDQRMPSMTGIEFLKRAAEMRPHTVRIILTGYTDVNSLVEAINSGVVYKYVTKPWVNEDLQQTVVRALEHYETIKGQYELKVSNERLAAGLEATRQGFIRLIANTLDMKDPFLHGQMRRTSNYAAAIGCRLNLDASKITELSHAAFLHKVGRIGIPDNLSHETAEENQTVKSRCERGIRMLTSIPDMADIASAVRFHTEHFDGSGAPEGLSDEQIPLFARIISVGAAYDRMTAPSANRNPLTHEEAVKQLRAKAGKDFDPRIVEVFCELESIGQIRGAINENLIGMRLFSPQTSLEANDLSTAELLQKFKTEPLPAMSVLKLANASGEPTAQLMPAMKKLGEATLRRLIAENGLPQPDEKAKTSSRRAVRRAVAAQQLAAHTNIIHPDEAYTMGLLQDVGETLLFDLFPDEMLALEKFDENVRARRQVERFGVDGAQVSRWMLEACKLPFYLTSAVNSPFEEMQLNTPTALLMYLAGKISEAQYQVKTIDVEALRADALTALNLSRADVKAINERANSIVEEQINARQNLYALV